MNTFANTVSAEKIDTSATARYNENDVRQIAAEAAQQAATRAVDDLLARFMSGSSVFLDNVKEPYIGKPCEEDSNMASNYCKYYMYMDTEGNQHSKRIYGANEKETDLKYQQFLQAMFLPRTKKAPTLRDFVENTYRQTFIDCLRPTTKSNYNRYLKCYIYPFLGDKHMDEITVVDIQAWYNKLAEGSKYGYQNDINRDSITRVSGLASRIFSVATEMEIISCNPIKPRLLKNNGKPAEHHKALPDAEVARIKLAIPYLKDERQRVYMALFAYTNLRREEVLGLKWADIDLENKVGHVVRAVTYPNNGMAHVGETKTVGSTGIFIIPEPLKEILDSVPTKEGFIIHGRDANMPVPYSTMQSIYQNAYSDLGIKGKYNNHDWRTTFATQLIEAGATSKQAADQLRHTSTRMVETVYANAREAGILKQRDLVERMNASFAAP